MIATHRSYLDHLLSQPCIQLLQFFVDYPPLISSANFQSSVSGTGSPQLRCLKEVDKHIVDQGICNQLFAKGKQKGFIWEPSHALKTKQIQQPMYNVAHDDLQQLHYFDVTFILLKCRPLYSQHEKRDLRLIKVL